MNDGVITAEYYDLDTPVTLNIVDEDMDESSTILLLPDPKVGTYVKPDGWPVGSRLMRSDPYLESSFPGCQFRLPSKGGNLAVNLTPIGVGRVKIEFVGDGEESTYCGGDYDASN
jgi:hypothetical protein